MSAPLIAGAAWVLLAAGVALLPMRRQFAPGLVLLIAAPGLIAWIGWQHGWVPGFLASVAFFSMFRHPLRYLWRKATSREAGQ